MYIRDVEGILIAEARAAEEQPRQAANQPNRRVLPHADPIPQQQSSLLKVLPLDCRLLIWEHVLQPPQIRIERWRPPNSLMYSFSEEVDADCFPYRITTAGREKTEKPLNLLLCCRQLYSEGLSLLYSTTFVFEFPRDLYDFQLCASPEGLSSVKSLVIALGQTDWPGSGPFFSHNTRHPNGSLEEWRNALNGLKSMRCVQELGLYLGHRHVQEPELERRPWKKDEGDQMAEQRHSDLFELFGMVDVPRFTTYLTWMPQDILFQRQQWPFRIELQTKDQMMHAIDHDLPVKTEPDLYDW